MALDAEILGPLEEIQFWRSRTVDLSGISDQLVRDDVRLLVTVLEAARSSYLGPFLTLSQRIKEGSVEANNNLKFLESITAPCQALASATPAEIPALLPHLLNCIRMIWSLSKFYNTEDRLTGLLRKISNEIIRRCCAAIDLTAVFSGDVDNTMAVLHQSRECAVQWKGVYRATAKLIAAATPDTSRHWSFDDASMFAQMDAFAQRCSDLLEICEGQIQFARKATATKTLAPTATSTTGTTATNSATASSSTSSTLPLPEFGGTRGQEVGKALLGIQCSR
eukprot:8670-Heterococcus_DN1.PRE.5